MTGVKALSIVAELARYTGSASPTAQVRPAQLLLAVGHADALAISTNTQFANGAGMQELMHLEALGWKWLGRSELMISVFSTRALSDTGNTFFRRIGEIHKPVETVSLCAGLLLPGTSVHEHIKEKLTSGILLETNGDVKGVAAFMVRSVNCGESVPVLVPCR